MKIVHVTDCYLPRVGGIERQVADLALLQQRHRHDVEVVTSTIGSSADRQEGVRVRRPPSSRTGAPGDIAYLWSQQGRALVVTGKFDVVHVHASAFSPLAFLAAAACTAAGIPTAVTVHSLLAYAAPLFRAADILMAWARWRVAWSAVSSIAAEPVQRMIGPLPPVTILPNGVDAASWRIVRAERDPARLVIATVGRLAVRKRPLALLQMLQRVRTRLPKEVELELVLIGEGPLRRSLQRFIVRHGMSGWVRMPGDADHEEIRAVYRGVDLYVAPATLESFGIAALEARCAGLPVVAYEGCGIADFITHDVEGLLAGNDDEMVDNILRLATSPSTLERIRRHNIATPPPIGWLDVMDGCDALYDSAQRIAADSTHSARPGVAS
jgi:glycosyltransferase involved in cell wall biosynthesis